MVARIRDIEGGIGAHFIARVRANDSEDGVAYYSFVQAVVEYWRTGHRFFFVKEAADR